jgi:23S rRNA pseudouridine1911/1915/1917 synthase
MIDDETEVLSFQVTAEDLKHKRLDTYLSEKLPQHSRSLIKKFFEEGLFSANVTLSLKKMPPAGSEILFQVPILQDTEIVAQNIPLEICYEDEYLVIINKPVGMVVHPAPGNYDGTLVNAILWHCPNLAGIGNEKRPGIVHRLDKGTSGLMVVAKEQKCHEGLVSLFSKHDIDRYYEAIVLGTKIAPTQTIESFIGRNPSNRLKMAANVRDGKKAVTHLKVLEYFKHFSHVELKLETGRTHQIRVHLSEILHHPILKDPLYGRAKDEMQALPSQLKGELSSYEAPFLHAKVLGFVHPITKEKLYFEKTAPEIFQSTLAGLKKLDV